MHTASDAFPMSSAATRSTSAPGSSVISSMIMVLPTSSFQAGCPREPGGGSEAESRARGNNAGPLWQAPGARLLCGLDGTKHRRLRRAPHPIFTLSGRRARQGRLLCFVKAFYELDTRRVCFLLKGGHDREGPLRAEGRLLSGHEGQQSTGK